MFKNYTNIANILCKRCCSLKSLSEIPTLKSYPLIGHSYLFLPGGDYKSERLTEAVSDLSKKFGPVFKLNLGGIDMCITTNADHVETLYRNEGVRPIRPPFPALLYYRQKSFNSTGVVPGNGEEWYKFRSAINCLLNTQLVSSYVQTYMDISKSFLIYIDAQRNNNLIVEDLFQHLLKFTIEAISVLSPGYRFNCLTNESNETKEIIQASVDFMDGLYMTLKEPPIWKFYKTKGYKKLESSHKTIHRILNKHLNTMKEKFTKDPDLLKEEQPFMYLLLSNKNLKYDDIVMLTMEIFLGGIDATATTIAFTLYYLAHNKAIQDLARSDAQTGDMKFLKSCLKETLRLSPTAGANSRFLVNDVQIDKYSIPKNTLVSAFNSVMSRDKKYFKEADKYNPGRWMRESRENFHKFASLPFGHGPRMCPGRRIAEQEMIILLKEILKKYRLEPVGKEDVGMVYRMNRIPDKPINIKFINTNY